MKKKRSTRYKSSLSIFLTLIFLLACSAGAVWSVRKFYESLNSSLTKMNEKPIAMITFKHKTAQRKFTERVIWDRLRQHSPVYDGDTIRTADGSEATIYFEDGNIMELGENTMAQVFFHDGQVETSVSGGTFVVNSSGAANGALVKTEGSTVVVNKGAAISASVSEESGTRVNVSNGDIVFTDQSGLARAIEEGEGIALDASGDEQIIPIVTVLSPSPNAKILAFSGSKESVPFSWTVQNLGKGDSLVLQTAADKKFSSIERSVDLSGMDEISIDFGEGVSYWRIFPKSAGVDYATQSKLKIISAPPPSLIAPESRSNYSYKTKLPDIRFSWSSNDIVAAFDLEIADNPQMQNPSVSQRTTTPSSIVSTLGTGTWYWRVTPYYSLNKIGFAKASEVRAFTISQKHGLDAPELILPAADEKINTALKDQINFSWKNNPEAIGYEIRISQDPQCYDSKIVEKSKNNFFTVRPSESDMQTGTWYWRVTQYDGEGDISEQSEIRKFTTDRVTFEQRAIYPPDNFVALDSNLQELRFTWKTNIPGDNKFQIARDKEFKNLVLDQVNNEKSFQGAALPGGQYYWRISSATSPQQYSTEPRGLRVAAQLSSPALLSPRKEESLILQGGSATRFGWTAEKDADFYQFNLYSKESGEPIVSERLVENFKNLDLSQFKDGEYSWSVQAGAEESALSSRRFSAVSESSFRISQLRKISLQQPLDGASIDGLEALSNPQKALWACEQEIKGGVFTLSRNPNGYSNPILSVQNPEQSVQLPRLEPGVYYWTVRGSNAAGLNASASKANSFTVKGIAALQNPRLSSPAQNTVYGAAQIRSSRKISFVWQPVPSATSYTFTLRNEKGQVLISRRLAETHYDLGDMAELKNGRFTYSVQARQNLSDGTLARSSGVSSASFSINLPAADDIVIDDTGVLYGM